MELLNRIDELQRTWHARRQILLIKSSFQFPLWSPRRCRRGRRSVVEHIFDMKSPGIALSGILLTMLLVVVDNRLPLLLRSAFAPLRAQPAGHCVLAALTLSCSSMHRDVLHRRQLGPWRRRFFVHPEVGSVCRVHAAGTLPREFGYAVCFWHFFP